MGGKEVFREGRGSQIGGGVFTEWDWATLLLRPGPAAVASVSGVARQIGRGIAFAFLFFRLDPPLTWLLLQLAVCPQCGLAPAPPRANSSLCPTTINNDFFCDPLKLAKNIPPPGAGAATRVVTQSPPIEFDSFFHSVSPISRQNPSLVTTLLPLLPSRRVGSLSRTLGPLVFSEHTYRRHFSIYGAASRQVQHPN